MLISKLVALSLAIGVFPSFAVADCNARDFLALPLPNLGTRLPEAVALEASFPGLIVDDEAATVAVEGHVLPLGEVSAATGNSRLIDPSIRDAFVPTYPLEFNLSLRGEPWFDPGRVRNEGLMKVLYGSRETEVAKRLVRIRYNGKSQVARFAMNARYCVAAQLQAALDAIAAEGPELDRYFRKVGGSFAWRVIAGTERLSAHSFGIAVDFNTSLGGYWRWSGASEGGVGRYDNQYPETLVRHMERFGFIWGGKWHHYDGMHFEYRPELILYARLVTGS